MIFTERRDMNNAKAVIPRKEPHSMELVTWAADAGIQDVK